jgi:hypothetical protein
MNIVRAIEEAAKIIDKVSRLANAAEGLRAIAERTLPKLRIPKLGVANNRKVEERYKKLVCELKAERAAHEKTRQYLDWATKEIENVKAAMREWQRKALVRPPRSRKPRHKKR